MLHASVWSCGCGFADKSPNLYMFIFIVDRDKTCGKNPCQILHKWRISVVRLPVYVRFPTISDKTKRNLRMRQCNFIHNTGNGVGFHCIFFSKLHSCRHIIKNIFYNDCCTLRTTIIFTRLLFTAADCIKSTCQFICGSGHYFYVCNRSNRG